MQELAEYLYVDQRRRDRYFEQISPPNKVERVLTWKFEASFTPSAEATQTKLPRPFTNHEKILRIVKYITKNEQVACSWKTSKTFVLESLRAQRAFIPADAHPDSAFPGIAMWLCLPLATDDKNVWYRYLIEDFPRDDAAPTSAGSGWSAFNELFRQMSEEIKRAKAIDLADLQKDHTLRFRVPWQRIEELEKTESSKRRQLLEELLLSSGLEPINIVVMHESISHRQHHYDLTGSHFERFLVKVMEEVEDVRDRLEKIRNRPGMARTSRRDSPELEEILSRLRELPEHSDMALVRVLRDNYHKFGKWFAAHPTEVLRELGAQVGPSRRIDVLYRIRETLPDSAYEDYAVIGYPIVIAAHPSPLVPRSSLTHKTLGCMLDPWNQLPTR